VIQLPSAPIEAVRIINIRFSIYMGTDRVRLNFFSKNRINRVVELNLNKPIATVQCSDEITITITIPDKNYNYSNNYEIVISDYISVYADHAIDKQISSADWSYLITLRNWFKR